MASQNIVKISLRALSGVVQRNTTLIDRYLVPTAAAGVNTQHNTAAGAGLHLRKCGVKIYTEADIDNHKIIGETFNRT